MVEATVEEPEKPLLNQTGHYSDWLVKRKSEKAYTRWLCEGAKRYFTIDFENQLFFYAHSEDAKAVSAPICFKDLISAKRVASPAPHMLRAQRRSSAPSGTGFVLKTRQRDFELKARSGSQAARWVSALNAVAQGRRPQRGLPSCSRLPAAFGHERSAGAAAPPEASAGFEEPSAGPAAAPAAECALPVKEEGLLACAPAGRGEAASCEDAAVRAAIPPAASVASAQESATVSEGGHAPHGTLEQKTDDVTRQTAPDVSVEDCAAALRQIWSPPASASERRHSTACHGVTSHAASPSPARSSVAVPVRGSVNLSVPPIRRPCEATGAASDQARLLRTRPVSRTGPKRSGYSGSSAALLTRRASEGDARQSCAGKARAEAAGATLVGYAAAAAVAEAVRRPLVCEASDGAALDAMLAGNGRCTSAADFMDSVRMEMEDALAQHIEPHQEPSSDDPAAELLAALELDLLAATSAGPPYAGVASSSCP
eukprot:TRINITY_DN4557_c0_g2_i1.p1 TRINITY_DN4557_c0_g2~~TRINITY_DN4557_c0_g2_i1.p1  ORF type:complete len:485 (+),score=102.03 TRINITY_DN4557_c0_g2_i1:112-1566(+)